MIEQSIAPSMEQIFGAIRYLISKLNHIDRHCDFITVHGIQDFVKAFSAIRFRLQVQYLTFYLITGTHLCRPVQSTQQAEALINRIGLLEGLMQESGRSILF